MLSAQPNSLDPSAALGLYLKVGPAGEWQYRGCVHHGHPSEVMPLQWPVAEGLHAPGPGVVQVGRSSLIFDNVVHSLLSRDFILLPPDLY